MHSLIGLWKLTQARAFDEAGVELAPPLGPNTMGVVLFDAQRVVGVINDPDGFEDQVRRVVFQTPDEILIVPL